MSGDLATLRVDRDGIVRDWSAPIADLLGYPAEAAIGRPMDFFVPPEERAEHWSGFRRAIESGVVRYGPDDLLEAEMLRADGSRIAVVVSLHPEREPSGRITAILARIAARTG